MENKMSSKLIELRKSHNLTQKELAEKINYSDKVISKWELGVSSPDIHAIKIIANYYNISTDDLLNIYKEDIVSKLDSNKLEFICIKKSSLAVNLSILPFLIFLIISILLLDFTYIFISTIIFLIYLIIYAFLISNRTFAANYKNHIIKLEAVRSYKVNLYVDNILVDTDSSMFGSFLVLTKIQDVEIKVRVSQLLIKPHVTGFISK